MRENSRKGCFNDTARIDAGEMRRLFVLADGKNTDAKNRRGCSMMPIMIGTSVKGMNVCGLTP